VAGFWRASGAHVERECQEIRHAARQHLPGQVIERLVFPSPLNMRHNLVEGPRPARVPIGERVVTGVVLPGDVAGGDAALVQSQGLGYGQR
jgi:hypothetical protein